MVKSGEEHSSLHLPTYFWPWKMHANSRGNTEIDFQDCSKPKSCPQVELEQRPMSSLSHVYTHTSVSFFGGHIRTMSIPCSWPRIHIKIDVKFPKPLWDRGLPTLATTISAYKPESFEQGLKNNKVGLCFEEGLNLLSFSSINDRCLKASTQYVTQLSLRNLF